jgi:beta-glucosidase-like glycosyl hydrolase
MTSRRELERMIGAVLVPEVRVAGTIASASEVVPSPEYLARFPPAGVVAFGRTPSGAVSPTSLIERVQATCRELGDPQPFVACDLEQGAGLHFAEGTRLPPALALASADMGSTMHADGVIALAASLTALEARHCGVRLVLAPVADVNTRGDNPIIAVRSFGDEPHAAAQRATQFLSGLHEGGVGGCAKHFPGHGDTSSDSHLVLPRVDRSLDELREVEFVPFAALIEARVDTVMVGHLDVPALTGEPGLPCTFSARAIEGVLRGELGFRGVVVSDAMNMGALAAFEDRYVRALGAGIEALLCPHDASAAAEELLRAVESGRLDLRRLASAAVAVSGLREWLSVRVPAGIFRAVDAVDQPEASPHSPHAGPSTWSPVRTTVRSVAHALAPLALRSSTERGPWPADQSFSVRDAWPATQTPEVLDGIARLRGHASPDQQRIVIPVICEARALLGKYGPSAAELLELERSLEADLAAGKQVVLAWFGSPQTVPASWWHAGRVPILLAFAPTPPMFGAVEDFLRGSNAAPSGSLPAKLG